jgi:pantothenate kinase
VEFDPIAYLLGRPEQRILIGITGCPGAGKSTFAATVAKQLSGAAIVLPMDGFHYTNARLDELDLRNRKGAPDTYDVPAFVNVLSSIRSPFKSVFAPIYSRVLHEPKPHAIEIKPSHRFVLVEGNYLLVDSPPWNEVAGLLDETWFLDVSQDVAADRLLRRHLSVGRSLEEARGKVLSVDMPNGKIVLETRIRADRVIDNSD